MGRPAIEPGQLGEVRPKQVKDRRWVARVRWRDQDGRYHRTSAEATTKKDCEDLVRSKIERERVQLQPVNAGDLTLDEIADLWIDALRKSRRRPSTIEQYRAAWRGALSPVIGADRINEVTRARVQSVLLDELFVRRRGSLAADGSWTPGEYRLDAAGAKIPLRGQQPRNVLNLVLRFAADRGYRVDGVNPLEGTTPPEKPRPAPRALTAAEAERLIELAREWAVTAHGASTALWHGLVVMRYTGVRLGELLGLTWDRVELDGEIPAITVSHTLLEPRGSVKLGLGPTKSGTTDIIALHPDAAGILRQRCMLSAGSGYVFATRTGRPVSHANFRRALRDLVRGTDLEWVHPHSFRHTLATRAYSADGDDAARDLLRHSDSRVTHRHYIESDGRRVLDPRWLFQATEDPND